MQKIHPCAHPELLLTDILISPPLYRLVFKEDKRLLRHIEPILMRYRHSISKGYYGIHTRKQQVANSAPLGVKPQPQVEVLIHDTLFRKTLQNSRSDICGLT